MGQKYYQDSEDGYLLNVFKTNQLQKAKVASKARGLDHLPPGAEQDGVGVWPGPEDPVTVVKVIVERFRDLVRAAVLVVLESVCFGRGRGPVRFARRRPLTEVRLAGSGDVLLLGLQGNQR